MDFALTPEQTSFRDEVRTWLSRNLPADWTDRMRVGSDVPRPEVYEFLRVWQRKMYDAGFMGLTWPKEYGGRGLTFMEEMILQEEIALAKAPPVLNILAIGMAGPTIIAYGTEEQKRRYPPKMLSCEEIWCQGYSEPNAGSDLANVQTRAERDGDQWVVTGQKVWTSLAHWADWCFVLCRTDRDAAPHRGISYLLVPMRQPGIEIRPIVQLTGTSEFNEVFFDGARTDAANVVGGVNEGWKVAMGTLAFERGASTLGQQLSFENELADILDLVQKHGRGDDPMLRQRLADAWIRLRIMRYSALRSLTALERGEMTTLTSVHKLYWATLHRDLGELAIAALGADGATVDGAPYDLSPSQRLFLFSRADTIYGGSNQIQRNVIGERALGLPRGPR